MAANELQAAGPLFADRRMAGRLLAGCLRGVLARADHALDSAPGGPLVLALPRGGVAIAREVADALAMPVEVLVTRKIGHPSQPELGVGAIAEGGEPVYDELLLAKLGLTRTAMRPVAERERTELHRRVRVYRGGRPPPDVAGRLVILVDDGLATGVTARAALRSLRARSAGQTVLAVPVAAPASMTALSGEADDLVALAAPATFRAVGEWYTSFRQLTDSDVLELLNRTPE
ncbi:MAG TPA: phosphoribosyltransferase family protein [Streptosporangiaceae bacterium]